MSDSSKKNGEKPQRPGNPWRPAGEKPQRPAGPARPGGADDGSAPSPRANRLLVLIALVVAGYLTYTAFFGPVARAASQADQLATNEFVTAVEEGRVRLVTYKTSDASIQGSYWKPGADTSNDDEARPFTSAYVGTDSLSELMAAHPDVTYKIDTSSDELMQTILFGVVPSAIMLGVFVFYMRRMNRDHDKSMDFGKTDALTAEEERPKVTFADVAGADEAVEELQEIRDFLADPEPYRELGAKIPRGVLLVGPPGTGKTLLAKAVAGEAGVPFFSLSGSDFVEMFVGVGASRVRDLFDKAKEAAPCIVFIDEIDAVGRQRGAGVGGSHDEREQTLNQLLVEMDGFEANEAVVLVAATNRPDILDPALLRPGRFDRQVTVDRPDVVGREKILRVHAQGMPYTDEVDFARLAKTTPGFTGADLANLMNEAALLAARRRKPKITPAELEEAMERIMAGPERKSRTISQAERTTIAYHESGHALVGHLLKSADPVHKISIVSRGQALGYTMQVPEEDRFLETRQGMLDQIAVLLGGRAAEEHFCADVTSGASNDLERATKLARTMVTRYGMSEELGVQVFGEAQHEVFLGRDYANHQDYSALTAERIDAEVSRIMAEGRERARAVLAEHADQMHTMARVLLERETVEGAAVDALLANEWDAYAAAEPTMGADKNAGKKGVGPAEKGGDEGLLAQGAVEPEPAAPEPAEQ